MKKFIKTVIISALIALCVSNFIDNVLMDNSRGALIELGASEIYTDEDLRMASHLVITKFRSFPAKLERLWYDEEQTILECEYWQKQYNTDDVLILYSDFTAKDNKRALNEGFEPGMKYEKWMWVLTKNESGRWMLSTWGY